MQLPDERILSFLKENAVANVCLLTSHNDPHCISCFYVFHEAEATILFKSSYGTGHDKLIVENAPVSGTILPNSIDPLQLRGIQFGGKLLSLSPAALIKYGAAYAQKYPMSLAIPGYIWAAKLEQIKLTDNSLGFGAKISWRSEA